MPAAAGSVLSVTKDSAANAASEQPRTMEMLVFIVVLNRSTVHRGASDWESVAPSTCPGPTPAANTRHPSLLPGAPSRPRPRPSGGDEHSSISRARRKIFWDREWRDHWWVGLFSPFSSLADPH